MGGAREIVPITSIAASGASLPAPTSSIVRIEEATHVYTGRIGHRVGDRSDALGRSDRLACGLAVDVKNQGESKDKTGTPLQLHMSFSQSMHPRAAASWWRRSNH